MSVKPGAARWIVLVVAGSVLAEHLYLATGVPEGSWQQHGRSPLWAAMVCVAIVLMLALREISAGCWLLIAGAAGNLIGWLQTASVPDYLTVVVGDRWIAFNLADAAIVTGAIMLLTALASRAAARRTTVAKPHAPR